MESTLTAKSQTTIPKAIRDHLQIKPGDRVKFFIHPDGSVVLLPKLPVSTLKEIVHRPASPVSLEAMGAAVTKASLANHRRNKSS